jgi:hypothetical protein
MYWEHWLAEDANVLSFVEAPFALPTMSSAMPTLKQSQFDVFNGEAVTFFLITSI